MPQEQPAIIGYCDPWSVRPGATLDFMISSKDGRAFRAHVVRVRSADPNPAGPGMKLPEQPEFGIWEAGGQQQQVRLGSYGRAEAPACGRSFFVALNARILRPAPSLQCMLALQSEEVDRFVAICVEGNDLVLRFGDQRVDTGIALASEHWSSLGIGIDCESARLVVEAAELHVRRGTVPIARRELSLPAGFFASDWSWTVFGALEREGERLCFDGQIEAPKIGAGELPQLAALGGALNIPVEDCVAAWDFSAAMTTQRFPDLVSGSRYGEFVNLPTRAMRGSNWSGKAMSWSVLPAEYGAVHFHSDDVGDLAWNRSLTLPIPAEAKSGVYALVVDNGVGEDLIPFYVLPAREQKTSARIAFLAPTMTYLAYANHSRGNWRGPLEQRARDWQAYPHNPDIVRDYGFSTYNYHPDGSGWALSSRRRPVLTMRPGFLTFPDANGSGLRHFPADTHLLDWLEEKGHEFDVITDEDLDEEGADILRPYSVVITGSHPEYYSENMLNGLERYRAEGGRLCYMGGNGFYWRIARSPELPWALEIRRAESGIRAWASEPGEYYNQVDGSYGGLWRRNGRPPQQLVEIGFAVQGLFLGSPYRRTEQSYQDKAAWIFDGVSEELIGDFGLSGGGAAGFELDQIAPGLGTSRKTVIVAKSEGHGPSFQGVPEDILTISAVGAQVDVEAHMVYSDHEGELFATGSITFLGSLSHNGYDNPISKILDNVIRRFSRPR